MAGEEQVVLCDQNGEVLGSLEKLEAHEKGILHRAFSVILYNNKGEMLIQQRALTKYHWAGIWSNACCSHPRRGESFAEAAQRRLYEELGINCELNEAFRFVYQAFDEPSGLTEHEYDCVFTGIYDREFNLNPEEVSAVRWISLKDLKKEIAEKPEQFSFWFKIILEKLEESYFTDLKK